MAVQEYDVIIIGAGHNGLVTAAYLAKEGINVLVLERRDMVGGACVTEELFPGFKFSTASMFLGLLQPKVIQDLKLPEYGYEAYSTDPTDLLPFPDGTYLACWKDEKKLADEISKFSSKDAQAYFQVQRFLDKYEDYITSTWLRTPPTFAEVAARFRTPEEQEVFRLIMMGSMAEFVDQRFESDAVKMLIAALAPVGNAVGLRSKGNMYQMFRGRLAEAQGERGVWGYSRGGMGGITQAIAKSAQAEGATIRTNAKIDHILVENGRTVGVALTSGEEIRAAAVASNADPKRTFLKLVEPQHLPENFRDLIGRINMKGDFAKMFLALDDRPQWACFNGADPGTQDHGFITISPSLEYSENAWEECMNGYSSHNPWFMLHIQSLTDPSLAPPGKHAMTVYIQYAPYDLKEGTWEEEKDRFTNRCIEVLSEYIPNLKDIILDRVFFGPRDLEERFYLTESTMHHGWMMPDQMFNYRPIAGWSDYRTPVQNLYLCGSGAHPGGGVSGAPGHNAAQEIIMDWREGIIS